jgi:hypothetical protein
MSLRTKKTPCPSCQKVLDAVTATDHKDHKPSPGDLTVCFYCAALLCFDFFLDLQIAQPEDLKGITEEQTLTIAAARAAINKKIQNEKTKTAPIV